VRSHMLVHAHAAGADALELEALTHELAQRVAAPVAGAVLELHARIRAVHQRVHDEAAALDRFVGGDLHVRTPRLRLALRARGDLIDHLRAQLIDRGFFLEARGHELRRQPRLFRGAVEVGDRRRIDALRGGRSCRGSRGGRRGGRGALLLFLLLGGGPGVFFGCRIAALPWLFHVSLLWLRIGGSTRRGDELTLERALARPHGVLTRFRARVRADRHERELDGFPVDRAVHPQIVQVLRRDHFHAIRGVARRDVANDLVLHVLQDRLHVLARGETHRRRRLGGQAGRLHHADHAAQIPPRVTVEQRRLARLQALHAHVLGIERELLPVVAIAHPVIALHARAGCPHEIDGALGQIHTPDRSFAHEHGQVRVPLCFACLHEGLPKIEAPAGGSPRAGACVTRVRCAPQLRVHTCALFGSATPQPPAFPARCRAYRCYRRQPLRHCQPCPCRSRI
jgi:hypothetical protein